LSEPEKKYPEKPEQGHYGIVAEMGKMVPLFVFPPKKKEETKSNG